MNAENRSRYCVEEEERAHFAEYLARGKRILIADSCALSSQKLVGTLVSLGAEVTQIIVAQSYVSAAERMRSQKPEIVLAEYHLEGGRGTDLIRIQKEQYPGLRETLFAVVSGDCSQAAVAESVREEVDAYVLKPYSQASFEIALVKSAIAKLFPNPYLQQIEAGKRLLDDARNDEAIRVFQQALKLNPRPTLACYYLGLAHLASGDLLKARQSFEQGLSIDHVHYRCLSGLFDLFMRQEAWEEAYGVIRQIVQFFPTHPEGVSSAIKLAVRTERFGDVPEWFTLFKTTGQQDGDLVRPMCAALIVYAKWAFSQGQSEDALAYLRNAAAMAPQHSVFRQKIRETLTENGYEDLH